MYRDEEDTTIYKVVLNHTEEEEPETAQSEAAL